MAIAKSRVFKILLIQILMLLFVTGQAIADFTGPFTVVEGTFGEAPNEFGIEYGDMGASVPSIRSVNIRGNIFVVDKGQVKIFNPEGHLLDRIKPKNVKKTFGWPASMDADSQNNIYTSNYDQKLQKYNNQSALLWEKNVMLGRITVQPDDTIFIWGYRPDLKGKERFIQFSPTGKILKTYTEKPLDLGVVEERSLENGQYKVTVKYADKEWVITGKGACQEYMKIGDCELYCLGHKQIVQYDAVGHEQSRLTIPEDSNKQIPRGQGVEPKIIVIEEYGRPVVSPIGDVYTWKRTPDKYSIIKWVWVDGPDAPQSLSAASSKTGITLTWEVPLEDAERVDEYEINRSADVCGPFRPIATVKKGILTYEDQKVKTGETYYYQIRAIRDKVPSGYSNKAIGKR